jgi:Zn-dependent protease with chaperone function
MIPHTGFIVPGLHVDGDFPLSPLVRFVFGGPIHNLWPVLIVPALAALATDRAAARLPRTPAASAAALALAAAPGVVALCIMLNSWLTLQPFSTWRGWVAFRLTPALMLALTAVVIARLCQRQVSVARLFAVSRPAGPRLAAAARGLRVRELGTAAPECFVAGVLRPTVFVSAGAMARLDDEALAAALAHERAHVRGLDPLTFAALSILRDLAPFGRGRALERLQAARESRADRAAAHDVGRLPLAAALVALARPAPRPAGVLPMAAAETLAWRMDALLGEPALANATAPAGAWWPVAFLVWPAVQWILLGMFCG